jgi:hypothetical protein
MNISTGGPHILLFERDQQLTALVTSEFQLAGYECHTARTAVEVFDALARYPIRIVLVDLAQAAAARREFWVALDTQRRGRGIHVLTFHCNNIAGYGPHDPDDRSQNTAADLDIDGMMGLMKLVAEVRNRVPGASSNTNTIPRLARTVPTQPIVTPTQRTGSLAPTQTGNTGSFRSLPAAENTTSSPPPMRSQSGVYPSPTTSPSTPPTQSNRTGPNTAPPTTNNTTSAKSVSYTDKIRAVLYPNQRSWSTPGNATAAPASAQVPQEQSPTTMNTDTRPPFQTQNSTMTGSSTTLQRLANGQTNTEGQAESGLAQLSRLAQANYAAPLYETNRDIYQQSAAPTPTTEARLTQAAIAREQTITRETLDSTPAEPTEQIRENISAQPLRASPIQDIPIDRPGGNQTTIEGGRRPDVLSRTNYGQQPTSTTIPPLASIAASAPPSQVAQASGTLSATSHIPHATAPAQKGPVAVPLEQTERKFEPAERKTEQVEHQSENADYQPEATAQITDDLDNNTLEDIGPILAETSAIKRQDRQTQGQAFDEMEADQNQNTMLFDIMQSLPPMPPIGSQNQTVQAQVLNGRATRSLGSVLLAGHLVPENRLEVAQNIQRMLRGVDLNYQLGEILLMFKLLTPDQLLAASLVSYGMITTAQVSALGRIRQELHSIGLEYDLENLLILFRILTPEQVREAKSGMQG